jgi:dehydrogenase/reductase SDR family member 12
MSLRQLAVTTQFYLYGKSHCTQTGWQSAAEKYLQPNLLNELTLDGKVFMVTGANGGIGYEISSYLAKKHATVYLICRSAEKAEKAREKIIEMSNNTKVFPILCDCSLQRDVRRAWNEFEEHQRSLGQSAPQLHGLVCNAGALLNDRVLTDEGVETTFAAHLLFGTYLLVNLAIPTLTATPDSRVVVVSSGGMYNTKFPQWSIATSQMGDYDGQLAYAYAKRGQVLLCEQWTKIYPEIKFVSCHPGWVDTDGVTAAYGDTKKYLEPLRTLWEGSEGILWLLAVDRNELEGGAFYLDRSPQVKHLSGAFFTEGSYTKNTPEEVEAMMNNLQKWSVLTDVPPLDWSVIAKDPLTAMKTPIDIHRFMGQWIVQGHIPTYFDQNTVNNIENYSWDEEKQVIRISFVYSNPEVGNDGITIPGPPKIIEQKGKIMNPENTEWALSIKFVFYWSVSTRYLIIAFNEEDPSATEYQSCLVGVPDRSGLWFMTRGKESVSEEVYQVYRNKAESLGYDVSKMVRVPYLE